MEGSNIVYLTMELAEEDLSQILPQRALAPVEVADLLPPLLDALSYLHENGLVHGRIQPSNVLAVGDQLKLSTDQIAPPRETDSGQNRRDVYDAPETADGTVSSAGDLWSLGVTLIMALTQSLPVERATSQSDVSLPASLPEPFRGIARECLRSDPKRRCSIADIRARLQPAGRSVPAEAAAAPTSRRSGNRGMVTAGVIAVALLVGVVAFYSRGKSIPAQSVPVAEQPAPETAPTVSAPVVREPAELPKRPSATRTEAVRQVLPDIPRSAMNTISGTIKISVRVEVDPSGKVTAAKLTSAGPSRYFSNLCLQAAQRWEFSPSAANGQPAASTWLLRFRLKRSGNQVSPERVTR
jgi:TonB family protein